MAKFETIFCAVTWGLVNALMLAVALGSASPTISGPPAPLGAGATATPLGLATVRFRTAQVPDSGQSSGASPSAALSTPIGTALAEQEFGE